MPPGSDHLQKISALSVALDRVGDRWSLAIVCAIDAGAARFNDLQRATSAPRASLISNLRRLEQCGLIARRQYQQNPVRWEYLLTRDGEAVVPIGAALSIWGAAYLPTPPRSAMSASA